MSTDSYRPSDPAFPHSTLYSFEFGFGDVGGIFQNTVPLFRPPRFREVPGTVKIVSTWNGGGSQTTFLLSEFSWPYLIKNNGVCRPTSDPVRGSAAIPHPYNRPEREEMRTKEENQRNEMALGSTETLAVRCDRME